MPGHTLSLSPLTAEAFAPFGDVIATEGNAHFPINSGMVQRFHDLASVDVLDAGGRPGISLFVAQPYPMPLDLVYLERHPLSSQAFVPLDGRPYIVIVAAADASPGCDTLRAFLAQGHQGVNYHRGVWHHVLIAVGQISTFAVVDRIGTGPNCDRFDLDPARPCRVDLPA